MSALELRSLQKRYGDVGAFGPADAHETLVGAFVAGNDGDSVLGGEPRSAFPGLFVWVAGPLALGLCRFERASL